MGVPGLAGTVWSTSCYRNSRRSIREDFGFMIDDKDHRDRDDDDDDDDDDQDGDHDLMVVMSYDIRAPANTQSKRISWQKASQAKPSFSGPTVDV